MSEVAPVSRRGRPPAVQPPQHVAPLPTDGGVLGMIAAAAVNPNVDPAKLAALFDLQERMIKRDAETAFNDALAGAQAKMPHVQKNGRVDLGGNKGYDFAKWEDMDRAMRPIMREFGLTLRFDVEPREGGGAVIIGTLRHTAGHEQSARVPLALDTGAGRNNLQAMGSTISYGKRYCAEMLFNIVREGADDDGKIGGRQTITEAEVNTLASIIKRTGTDLEIFLDFMKVESLADIEKQEYAKAINGLAAKLYKLSAAAPEGK